VQHDALAEVARLASGAIGQCHSWGPQEHRSTYERILAAAMRYSTVVNYAEAPSAPPSNVLELRLADQLVWDEFRVDDVLATM
jgi:hypothetical protein